MARHGPSEVAVTWDRLLAAEYPTAVPGYFDSAAVARVPATVGRAVQDCYAAMALGLRGRDHWRSAAEQARVALAEEFGAAAENVSFLASTGEALNAIARAVPWQPGDEVLVLADDFPSVILPWSRIDPSVHLVRAEPLPGDDRLGGLLAAITERTRLVAVSHVNSSTGTRIDLAALGAACARAGALLVCDGAQAAGCIPVDVGPVDFYVATGYKWLLAGFGIALVIAKPAALAGLRPTLLGHGNEPPAARLPYGHQNAPGVCALRAGAEVRRRLGYPAVHDRIAVLVRRIHEQAASLGLPPVADLERSGPIVSLSGFGDADAAVSRLDAAGIAVAQRDGYVRISPSFYTTDHDVDALLHALAELSRDG
jgi:selenocysteine lyase/cysteine desulfurase